MNPTAPASAPIFIDVAAPVNIGGAAAGPVGFAGTGTTVLIVVGLPAALVTMTCVVATLTGTVVVAFLIIMTVVFMTGGLGMEEGVTGVLVDTLMLLGVVTG
jgi:hypothetical protein